MATRKEASWPLYTATNRVITAVAAASKAVLIKIILFIYSLCPLNTQRNDGVAMVAILLLLLLLLLSPVCRLFTVIYLKQTMFPGHIVLQLFCIYTMRYLQFYFACEICLLLLLLLLLTPPTSATTPKLLFNF